MAYPKANPTPPWRTAKGSCPCAEPQQHTGTCHGKGAEHHGYYIEPRDGLMYGMTCPCCENPVTCPVCKGKRGRRVQLVAPKQKGRQPPGTVGWPCGPEPPDAPHLCRRECERCFEEDDNVGMCSLAFGHRGQHECDCCDRKWRDDVPSLFSALLRADEEQGWVEAPSSRKSRAEAAALAYSAQDSDEESPNAQSLRDEGFVPRDAAIARALRDEAFRPKTKARKSNRPPPRAEEPSPEPDHDEWPRGYGDECPADEDGCLYGDPNTVPRAATEGSATAQRICAALPPRQRSATAETTRRPRSPKKFLTAEDLAAAGYVRLDG